MKENREFEVVVYGASGFTGRLVAEYLQKEYGSELRWAMAGRSEAKLQEVRQLIGVPTTVRLVVADVSDAASVASMVRRTRVVVSTVGPYIKYGEVVVAACAREGTDYVDLCGEVPWMASMIAAHEAAAKASGARIVFSCGFDSVPSDLGVFVAQTEARKRFGGPASRVHGRVRKAVGTWSGGTAASMRSLREAAVADPAVATALRNPFALTPGFAGPAQPATHAARLDPATDQWVAPFLMAGINSCNVHRSNFLQTHAYGTDFCYDEMICAGAGDEGRVRAEAMQTAGSLDVASKSELKPGEGPSLADRNAGMYDIIFIAEPPAAAPAAATAATAAPTSTPVQVVVTGDKDPGYGSTSKMISEAAMCLVKDATETPGGIYTPAAAMGHKLVARLTTHAGLTFTVLPPGASPTLA